MQSEIKLEKPIRGYTTKVFKGSFWVILGQAIPLFTTLITTPIVIRQLGTEAYGVLLLLGLVTTYFSFADFGMGLTSTKYASEAFSEGNQKKETAVVQTAVFISFCFSLFFAVPIFIFSWEIMHYILKVPESLLDQASKGLKITAISLVLGISSNIFNSPQLARMRMDLNVIITTGGKLIMTIATPIVLYFGGGIIGACWVALIASSLILFGNIIVSMKLVPNLLRFSVSIQYVHTLVKFGKNIVYYAIGLVFINYIERFILARFISVSYLSYYSIASTFAILTTMFSVAMVQSLLPAFSQLLTAEKRQHLQNLFSRTFRINLILILPFITFLIVIAKPFFTIWAGPDFGREGIVPYYILMLGIFLSMQAIIPYSLLMASGKSTLFARLYLIELIPYTFLVYILVNKFGIIGAAISVSIKESINAVFAIYWAKSFNGLRFNFKNIFKGVFISFLFLLPSIIIAIYFPFSYWNLLLLLIGLIFYMLIISKKIIEDDEKKWLKQKYFLVFNQSRAND